MKNMVEMSLSVAGIAVPTQAIDCTYIAAAADMSVQANDYVYIAVDGTLRSFAAAVTDYNMPNYMKAIVGKGLHSMLSTAVWAIQQQFETAMEVEGSSLIVYLEEIAVCKDMDSLGLLCWYVG